MITANGCEGGLFEKAAYGNLPSAEGLTLKLLVVQKPLTYRKIHDLETGLELELLQQFALDMGYRLKIRTVRNEKILAKELSDGKGDLGAARFSNHSHLVSAFRRSPTYDVSSTSLICRKSSTVEFTSKGRLKRDSRWKLIVNPTTVESRLVQKISNEAPRVRMVSKSSLTPLPILRDLSRGQGDCTLMDRLEAQFYLRLFANLEIRRDLPHLHSYFFLVSNSRPELEAQLSRWMAKASSQHFFLQAKNRIQGEWDSLPMAEIRSFLNARTSVFPRYAALLRKYSDVFNLPWQLSAAVAYQESKWNPEAESFTGVRGFMQLTQETAEHLGVEDRTDTEQSIWGGTKYLRMLLDRQPKYLPFREKLALALATYNVGPAHMLDAQNLAQKLGKNPHSWKDLKSILPLLADEDYLSELKYGPARGHEPVEFVSRVLVYLDLISVPI